MRSATVEGSILYEICGDRSAQMAHRRAAYCLRTPGRGGSFSFGGGITADVSGVDLTNTGAAYSPETDSWRPISKVGAPSPRHSPATVWTGEELIVYGGNAGVDARAYNPVTDSWRKLSLKGAPGLHTRGDAVWTGTEMLLWGRTDCDVGRRYDLAADTWKAFSSQRVPLPRSSQSLVWTGDALLIYGGTIGTEFSLDTNSGALYTP